MLRTELVITKAGTWFQLQISRGIKGLVLHRRNPFSSSPSLFVEPHSQPLRFATSSNPFAMDAFTKVPVVVEEVEIPSDFEGPNGGGPTSGCVVV